MSVLIFIITGTFFFVASIMLFYRKSGKIIHLVFLFTGLFIIVFLSDNNFLHVLISPVIIGATAGYTFRNHKTLLFFLFVTSLTIAFIFTFNHYYLKNFKNINILNNTKEIFIDLLKENNISDSEKKQIIQKLDESLIIMADIVPFVYFLNALILSLFSIYFLKYVFHRSVTAHKSGGREAIPASSIREAQNKSGEKYPAFLEKIQNFNINKNREKKDSNNIDSIERFKVKEYLIFIYIAGWFIVLLVDRTKEYFLYVTGLNAALIFSCFYLIQAFGIIKFFLRKKGLPFLILPAVMLSLLFLGIEYFLFILIIMSSIGAIDFWADFRKLDIDAKNS